MAVTFCSLLRIWSSVPEGHPMIALLRTHRWPALGFVGTWLLLNALFFVPLYGLNQETTTFLPGATLFADGWRNGFTRLLLWRENLDPLRLSLEWMALLWLWMMVRPLQRRLVRILWIALYILILCYYLYEAIMVSLYRTEPVFYSHYFLARDGLPFLLGSLQTTWWAYLLGVIGLFGVLTLLIALLQQLLNSAQQVGWGVRIGFTLLLGLSLVALVRYQSYTASPEMVVSSLSYKLQKNIASSRQLYQDIASFDDAPVQYAYNYVNYPLAETPDIYLIFIESYGSVLYKRPDFSRVYRALLQELESELAADGWQAASALSESPTWGGGSWMAYTSFLLGLRIDNHPQYLALLNKYQVETYPDLGRYLRQQGYYYAWVSPIARELSDEMWLKYIRFLGVDTWLRFRDLDYQGPQYGWGPAPPDQYVLHQAQEQLKASIDQPLLFVTLTQNSHYPWLPLPTPAEDWRTLSMPDAAPGESPEIPSETSLKRQNYWRAIDYELRTLTNFIKQTNDRPSLFILVGDHQPPQVSRRSDGWETPIHIISQDQALLTAFADYGFTPGLEVGSLDAALHHEGFYSLFVRIMQEQTGNSRVALPNFLPNGIIPGQPILSMP